MPYPEYISVRNVSIGGAAVLESAALLKIQVAITSSRSLVWNATGFRFESYAKTVISALGSEVEISLPRTDVAGWRDAATGSLIDVSVEGSYSHQYTAQIRFLDENDNAVGSQYTLGPFALPDGEGTFDLDTGVPASTVAGGVINIPDIWSQAVADAQAAAAAAEAALIDSDAFIASKVVDSGSATGSALNSTFVPHQDTAPDEALTEVWADTSTTPPTMKGWDGSGWVAIGGEGGGVIPSIVVRSVIVATGSEARPAGADVVVWIDADELGAVNALATDPIIVPGDVGGGGGGGGYLSPPRRPGEFAFNAYSGAINMSGAPTITENKLYCVPLYVTGPTMTVDRIGIRVETVGGVGAIARLGIYEVDSDGRIGNLVVDAGTVDCTFTEWRMATVDVDLPTGTYLTVVVFNDDVCKPMHVVGDNKAPHSMFWRNSPGGAEWPPGNKGHIAYGSGYSASTPLPAVGTKLDEQVEGGDCVYVFVRVGA